jgi:hypothetical protein
MVQLYPFLPGIVDAMVRALDPNTPEARAALLPLATVNFAELVRNYPNVAFHSPSQRLAVGSIEGIVVIYDLRIAARILILEVSNSNSYVTGSYEIRFCCLLFDGWKANLFIFCFRKLFEVLATLCWVFWVVGRSFRWNFICSCNFICFCKHELWGQIKSISFLQCWSAY